MTTTPTETFLDALTSEEDALDAITAIRERFNFTGTLFTGTDVEDQVDSLTIHSPAWRKRGHDFTDAFLGSIVKEIQSGYEYRKLGDILAERGNETLGDAAVSTVGLLEDGNSYDYDAQLLVDQDSDNTLGLAMERSGFATANEAFQWARQYVGTKAVACVPLAESDRLFDDYALALQVSQVALVVRHGETQIARFVSDLN